MYYVVLRKHAIFSLFSAREISLGHRRRQCGAAMRPHTADAGGFG